MITTNSEPLLSVVDEETYIKICEYMQGMRVYFSTKSIRNYKIKKDYEHFIKNGYSYNQVVEQLANKYELSAETIKRLIAKRRRNCFEV